MTMTETNATGKTKYSGQYSRTTYMVLCGLFAALMAICALIVIPLGFTPIPVSLGTLGVFLTGGLLGKKYGTISMTVYVLLGAAGIPIFAGFRGGLGVLVGPTGGYILGYIAAVFIIGLLIEKLIPKAEAKRSRAQELAVYAAAMIIGLAVCYALGTLWFMVSTHTGVWAALVSCVFPFLPGDALKIAAGALLTQRLRHLL